MQQITANVSESEPLLYDRDTAAVLLGVSVRKIDNLLARGELATVKIDARTLIPRVEILSFISKNTQRRSLEPTILSS